MHRGGTALRDPTFAYETWGKLNADRTNAVMLFTGLSPSAHAASSMEDETPGWREEMVGPGRPIDQRPRGSKIGPRKKVATTVAHEGCVGPPAPATGTRFFRLTLRAKSLTFHTMNPLTATVPLSRPPRSQTRDSRRTAVAGRPSRRFAATSKPRASRRQSATAASLRSPDGSRPPRRRRIPQRSSSDLDARSIP